jgi:3-phenylpropionate/trans-cinnamate dioxygenase ferredoxin component
MAQAWHDVGAASDITEDQPLGTKVGDKEIGVFKLGAAYHAIEDICPHAYALLSSGFVDGDTVECPLHQATFHIPTGKCTAAPAERDVAVYPVKIEGGRVFVQV